MKRTIYTLAAMICLPFIMNAQRVEVTPLGGYVFGGTMQGNTADVHINDNAQYGGMISIAASRVMDIDLIYNRSDTKAQLNYSSVGGILPSQDVPISINYMQVGFTKNFRVNPKVSPFIGFNMGACLFYPKETYSESWFFSLGVNAGAKVYFSKRVGLRLQAQGYMPVQGTAFSMFVGTGGAGSSVSVYSTLFQFGFTGGLIFRLGHIQ